MTEDRKREDNRTPVDSGGSGRVDLDPSVWNNEASGAVSSSELDEVHTHTGHPHGRTTALALAVGYTIIGAACAVQVIRCIRMWRA